MHEKVKLFLLYYMLQIIWTSQMTLNQKLLEIMLIVDYEVVVPIMSSQRQHFLKH
jgi:hypothetical protein